MQYHAGRDTLSPHEKRGRIEAKALLVEAVDRVLERNGGDIRQADAEIQPKLRGMHSILRLVLRGNPVSKIRGYLVARRNGTQAAQVEVEAVA
jgi:hypothetical protein